MYKIDKNEKGFGAIEVLLVLIFLAIIAFIGVYVAHNHNVSNKAAANSSTAKSSDKSAQSLTNLTLAQAASQVNYVYTKYENEVLGGQVLQDKSQWASNNVSAAEDLQFINNHKPWFTPAFIAKVNNYETTNTSPQGGELLMCTSGSVWFNNGSFIAQGEKESGTTANLNLTYTVGDGTPEHGPKTTYSLPMTVKTTNANTWAIDSINLSSCGS